MSQILLAAFGSPIASPQTFTWVSNGDLHDALYFIGRNYGIQAWANPHPTYVTNSMSSNIAGAGPICLTNRAAEYSTTNNNPDEWIKIDLGASNTIVVSDYSIRNGNDGMTSTISPRNWRLRGSNDDSTWFDLDIREPDSSLGTAQGDWAHFICSEGDVTPYRYIQLLNTGPNNNVDVPYFLQLCEIQLYGVLTF